MDQKFNKIRKFFSTPSVSIDSTKSGDVFGPQLGFRVAFSEMGKQLKVKVIGARQLPTMYGNVKPLGYVVKISMFPQRDKFETETVKESWPTFNEEFVFNLQSSKKSLDILEGTFISFTVYAALEYKEEKSLKQSKSVLKRFLSFSEDKSDDTFSRGSKYRRSTNRHSLNSRRTIGAITYNLNKSIFTQRLPGNMISTPDVWREIKEIATGMANESREGKKGSAEITLAYSVSEDGTNDVVEITITKFRCNFTTMGEHEKLGGQLYLKISAFGQGDIIQKMKSVKFDPTISLKIEPNTATLRAMVNKHNLKNTKILIRLMSTNMLGKKTLCGKIEIDTTSEIWKQITETPSVPFTKMIPFE